MFHLFQKYVVTSQPMGQLGRTSKFGATIATKTDSPKPETERERTSLNSWLQEASNSGSILLCEARTKAQES
jgi:hypothetical protein